MDVDKQALRLGAGVIIGAVVLRLLSGGLGEMLFRPEVLSMAFFLETGRPLRQVAVPTEPTQPIIQTEIPTATDPAVGSSIPKFTREQADNLEIRYDGAYRPDLGELLTWPLTMDLTEGEPAVLIVHTHTTEGYAETAPEYRSQEESSNMVAIGNALAEALEHLGISVLHDTTVHDYPSYNGSYEASRETVQAQLAAHPTIQLVLDIHRDALEDDDGQIGTYAEVDGAQSAQLMLVIGTDEGGLVHPNWQENLALGEKLQVVMEQRHPGIMRPMSLRTERFNQDLGPHYLLIEVGLAGNSQSEALLAARALAQGLGELAKGANWDEGAE